MEELENIKHLLEQILGSTRKVSYKIGQTVKLSQYPPAEKVIAVISDFLGYEFIMTDYRVKHSLKLPKYSRKRKRKSRDLPYLQKAWKEIHKAFKAPDAIAIYGNNEGIVYVRKIEDKYVLFAVNPKTRAIDTAFVKSSLRDTERYHFIYKRGGNND
jgi:hypothetical protein